MKKIIKLNNEQKLKAIETAEKISKLDPFYTINEIEERYLDLLNDINNRKVILHIEVSRSGINRKMSFYKHNMIINALYHGIVSYEPVKVGGTGMDMVWHLLYTVAKDERLNGACSDYTTI